MESFQSAIWDINIYASLFYFILFSEFQFAGQTWQSRHLGTDRESADNTPAPAEIRLLGNRSGLLQERFQRLRKRDDPLSDVCTSPWYRFSGSFEQPSSWLLFRKDRKSPDCVISHGSAICAYQHCAKWYSAGRWGQLKVNSSSVVLWTCYSVKSCAACSWLRTVL